MKKTNTTLTAFFLLFSLASMGQALTGEAAAGKSLYQTYCQSCHGEAGKGNGPVAQYLVLPPADLTRIALRRDGAFPEKEIQQVIDGRREVRVHGNSEMPVWGDAFRQEGPSEKAEEKIRKLVAYLKTIQEEEE
ncbi:MAG: cytochrome c [Phaeodactylibacter sp.]|nr:cytochrome c [Phaeodactylibacter sp.]